MSHERYVRYGMTVTYKGVPYVGGSVVAFESEAAALPYAHQLEALGLTPVSPEALKAAPKEAPKEDAPKEEPPKEEPDVAPKGKKGK